jgi:hypothetical protein
MRPLPALSLALFLVLLVTLTSGCPTPVQPNINYFFAGQFSSLHGVRTFDAWKRNPDIHCGNGHPGEPDDMPTGGDDVLVGFRTWLNPDTSCTNTVIRSYRGYVLFDLTPLNGKANLYAGTATLDFDLVSSTTPNTTNSAVCAATLASVIDVWPPDPVPFEQDFVLPGSGFWRAGSTPAPISFPSTDATGTFGPVHVNPGANAAAHFSINVDPFVRVWLANSAANHGLVFTSIYETFLPLPPTANNSCLNQFNNFMLRVYTY